ncbi:MAG: hypothetical protein KGQ36_02755 [Rickettsiales bacterium]|nr:hypothetical protein [Rickettsiales bacterium]
MSDAKGPAPSAVNSAMLASMADHAHTDSSHLGSGSRAATVGDGESHHPIMQDRLINSKLGQSLSANSLDSMLPTGKFEIPGSEGVFDQQLSLGVHEAPLGHNLGGGVVGLADVGAGNLGFGKQTHLPDLKHSLSTKGQEGGH